VIKNIPGRIKRLKQTDKFVYDNVFFKQIDDTHRFEDYRYLLLVFADALQYAKNPVGLTELQKDFVGSRVLDFERFLMLDYPFFFVSNGLTQALQNTSIENIEIDPDTIHLPYECFCFVFPKGGIDILGRTAVMMFIHRIRSGTKSELLGQEVLSAENESDVKLEIEAIFDDEQSLVRGISEPVNLNSDVMNLNFELSDKFRPKDAERLKVIADMFFKILFAMAAKPEIVSTPGKERKSNKGKTFVNPIIIGKKYRYESANNSNGDGQKKRIHWRRGHFRNQPYGSLELEERPTKIIWIEPMLINAEVDRSGE